MKTLLILLFFLSSYCLNAQVVYDFNDTIDIQGPSISVINNVFETDSFYYAEGSVDLFLGYIKKAMFKMTKQGALKKTVMLGDVNENYSAFIYCKTKQTKKGFLSVSKVYHVDSLGLNNINGHLMELDNDLNVMWSLKIDSQMIFNATGSSLNSNVGFKNFDFTIDKGYIVVGSNGKYLLKLDSLRNIQWICELDSVNTIVDVVSTPDNGYLVLGNHGTNTITKVNSIGVVLWQKPVDYKPFTLARDLIVTKDNACLMLRAINYNSSYGSRWGIDVTKFDLNGNAIWSKTYTKGWNLINVLFGLAELSLFDNGNILISGAQYVDSTSYQSSFTFTLNQFGDSISYQKHWYGQNSTYQDIFHAIPTSDGGILSGGRTFVSNGDIPWVFKTKGTITDIVNLGLEASKGLIYPNPAKADITIKLSPDKSTTSIEIYDVNGRHLQTHPARNDQTEVRISVASLSNGVYMIRLKNTDGNFEIHKLIVSR